MFKIGDLIVNKKDYEDEYRITTCKRGYIGRIIRICNDYEIEVETVEIEEGMILEKFVVCTRHFELYKDNRVTIDKIKESENKKFFGLDVLAPFNFKWGDR